MYFSYLIKGKKFLLLESPNTPFWISNIVLEDIMSHISEKEWLSSDFLQLF